MSKDKISGGLADNKTVKDLVAHHGDESWASIQFESLEKIINSQLEKGIKVELEHTDDAAIAREIAIDHIWEDKKYYDKLETVEESTKKIIKNFLKEDVKSFIIDESPDTITVLIKYNDRNAGIVYLTPANIKDTMEIVGVKFKKDYDSVFIMSEAMNSLWNLFEGINAFIVSPKVEGVEKWNKFGYSRISPNYLIANRGH